MTNQGELLKRHKSVMPGWISLYYDDPIEISHGDGFRVWDSGGNEYLDFGLAWGPLILGHSPDCVVEAIRQQAGKGLTFGAQHGSDLRPIIGCSVQRECA